jgi:hypothetical protein
LPCPPPMYRPLVPPTLDTQLQLQTQPVKRSCIDMFQAILIFLRHSQLGPSFSFCIFQSSESIDAAIGDVLTKPWLPLPLGLKPPSVDSVMGELQRQGVANVPPACE